MSLRVQFPSDQPAYGSIGSITYTGGKVNIVGVSHSQLMQNHSGNAQGTTKYSLKSPDDGKRTAAMQYGLDAEQQTKRDALVKMFVEAGVQKRQKANAKSELPSKGGSTGAAEQVQAIDRTTGTGGKTGLTSGSGSDNLQSSSKPLWSAKEAKEPFDYWELSADKTGFPRRWKPTHFSPSTLEDHYLRHGEHLGATSEEDYQKKAITYLMSPRGAHGDAYVRLNGDVCRYDYDTKVLVIGTRKGLVKTYWNLGIDKGSQEADKYWEENVKDG